MTHENFCCYVRESWKCLAPPRLSPSLSQLNWVMQQHVYISTQSWEKERERRNWGREASPVAVRRTVKCRSSELNARRWPREKPGFFFFSRRRSLNESGLAAADLGASAATSGASLWRPRELVWRACSHSRKNPLRRQAGHSWKLPYELRAWCVSTRLIVIAGFASVWGECRGRRLEYYACNQFIFAYADVLYFVSADFGAFVFHRLPDTCIPDIYILLLLLI